MDASWPPPHEDVVAHYDARAESYDDSELHRRLAEEAAARVGPLTAGATVVDVAAGTGLALRAIAEHGSPGLDLVAVDPSPAMLAVAARELPGVRAVEGRAEGLPLPDACADAATCVTALWLLDEPEDALDELARVLRPGGRVVVQSWSAGSHLAWRVLARAAAATGVALPDPDARCGTPEALRALFDVLWFDDVAIDEVPHPASAREEAADAWAGVEAGLLARAIDVLPADVRASIRRRFEADWPAARAAEPEGGASLFAVARRSTRAAPAVVDQVAGAVTSAVDAYLERSGWHDLGGSPLRTDGPSWARACVAGIEHPYGAVFQLLSLVQSDLADACGEPWPWCAGQARGGEDAFPREHLEALPGRLELGWGEDGDPRSVRLDPIPWPPPVGGWAA